jgi:hypothetical protein
MEFTTLAAAAFAGLVAIGATVAIERFGGVIGGILATLPTTIVPAAWGMYVASPDVDSFRAGMWEVPAGMLVNGVFLWSWRAVPGRLPRLSLAGRLALMTVLSLLVWAAAAAALVLALGAVRAHGGPLRALGLGAELALVGLGVAATWRPRPASRGRRRVSPVVLLARGLLAAVAVAAAVAIAGVGGALIAGMVSVFPAIFLTTMVSLWLAQGEAVPAGAVGPMMVGSSAVGAFALIAAELHPLLGPGVGTLAAWPVAVLLATVPAWAWLSRRAGAASGAREV